MSTMKIMALCLVVVLFLVLVILFRKSFKTLAFMTIRTLLGGGGIYIWNMVFASLGFSIGLNVVTAAVFGLFGLPGLVLLCFLKFVYG